MSVVLVPSGDGFRVGLGWWSFAAKLTVAQFAVGAAAFLLAGIAWYLVGDAIKTKREGRDAVQTERREPSLDQGAFAPTSQSPAPNPSLGSPATTPL